MSSRGCKAEEEREYRVSEPRQHPQGFTEYRVTARIISKKTADVVEITVFKRYSDFKKLHSELSYIHRNLFRKSEEFPAFPRAQVFGRFDEAVIEERRRSAEEMLQFTVNIPALYNSPQLKDFFKDGEVSRPLELAAANDAPSLPAPLIPLPSGEGELPGSWPSLSTGWAVSGGLPQSLSRSESDGGGEAVHTALHGPSPHGPAPHSPPRHTPGTVDELDPGQGQAEETNSPFDSGTEEERDEAQLQTGSHLCDTELALFDPCAKEEFLPDASQQSNLVALTVAQSSTLHADGHLDDLQRRLLHLRVQPDNGMSESEHPGPDGLGGADYLRAAADCIKEALEREATGEYEVAFSCYRNGVDILLKGVQGDLSAERRDAVKKKTAEYLKHAETIFTLHLKDSLPTDVTPST
ncbi:sorting nexin-15 isoform X2 [Carcharodon carcharias]|uniref:sorting nexin-15 isoform X2 n=1 Tax=Carcharodon carcharias TaxID=13397 RepID=UPI001B7EF784|nr:sorting nexin-15 isoform X2 [Carcharodon carcharias]